MKETPKIFITTLTFEIAVVTVGTVTFFKCSIIISTVKSITNLMLCVRLHSFCSKDHASSWISNTTKLSQQNSNSFFLLQKLSVCKCRNSIVSAVCYTCLHFCFLVRQFCQKLTERVYASLTFLTFPLAFIIHVYVLIWRSTNVPFATLCFLLTLSHLIWNLWYTKFSSVHYTYPEQIYFQYTHYLCLPLNS